MAKQKRRRANPLKGKRIRRIGKKVSVRRKNRVVPRRKSRRTSRKRSRTPRNSRTKSVGKKRTRRVRLTPDHLVSGNQYNGIFLHPGQTEHLQVDSAVWDRIVAGLPPGYKAPDIDVINHMRQFH